MLAGISPFPIPELSFPGAVRRKNTGSSSLTVPWPSAQEPSGVIHHRNAVDQYLALYDLHAPSPVYPFGGNALGSQSLSSLMPCIQPSQLVQPTPTFAARSRALLSPPTISGSASDSQMLALQSHSHESGSSPYTPSSSPSMLPETGNVDTSPQKSNDPTVFGRLSGGGGRQRTVQACEKCRDRKTKVSHYCISMLWHTPDLQALFRPWPRMCLGSRHPCTRHSETAPASPQRIR
ncbi:hypothetical protein EW145_g306 [Phellinidium pouzarii]|uniref:Uncharacterized protein n=1 Tax=Phellinidium pouzarii TaxID=167371 RepID=A0A4S4LIY4_9AGAM|nr:hypothetical protein EW145_g306 [Phellinidium pouzarii]